MDMAWKREAVATSPPKGMEQMLKWRNNPTAQPKETVKVKLLQDKAEPTGRRIGRRLASVIAMVTPGPAWACGGLKPTWSLCSQHMAPTLHLKYNTDTPAKAAKTPLHMAPCCILFASPDPARVTVMAEPVAWSDCCFPSRCKMAPSFLSFPARLWLCASQALQNELWNSK